jgi:hypothetical protein
VWKSIGIQDIHVKLPNQSLLSLQEQISLLTCSSLISIFCTFSDFNPLKVEYNCCVIWNLVRHLWWKLRDLALLDLGYM